MKAQDQDQAAQKKDKRHVLIWFCQHLVLLQPRSGLCLLCFQSELTEESLSGESTGKRGEAFQIVWRISSLQVSVGSSQENLHIKGFWCLILQVCSGNSRQSHPYNCSSSVNLYSFVTAHSSSALK